MRQAKKLLPKTLFIVLSICIMMSVLAACGAKYANSEYLGTWKATSASMSGIDLNVGSVIGEFSIKLEEDGTANVTIDKKRKAESGKKLKRVSS